MGISKKGKRKITVNSKEYLWWVFDETDQTEFDGMQIKLVAADQSIYIKYGLQQNDINRYVVLALHHDAGKVHYACPKFENDEGIITPAGIHKLIDWCRQEPDAENDRLLLHSWDSKNGILDPESAAHVFQKIQSRM